MLRVLVVDDDQGLRLSVKSTLTSSNRFEVDEALFDPAARKFRHVGRAGLGGKHYGLVIDGDRQRKYAAARLDIGLCIGSYDVAASIIKDD